MVSVCKGPPPFWHLLDLLLGGGLSVALPRAWALTRLSPLWSPGSHVLASGSVRIPRFMLLESGGLHISPVFIQDAGTYTCYAANTEGSLNASATLTVWSKDPALVSRPVLCSGTSWCPHSSAPRAGGLSQLISRNLLLTNVSVSEEQPASVFPD